MNEKKETEPNNVPAVVSQSKGWRKRLDVILQEMKRSTSKDPYAADDPLVRRQSRSRSLAITHLEDTILRLGMDLKEMREEGIAGCENPYPQSYNPQSPVIEKTAQGLGL